MSTIDAITALEKFFPDIALFRDRQEEVVDRLIRCESTLFLAPTGLGKSLVYQLAGLAMGKITLVISPLKALIDQQAQRLTDRGFETVYLHSGMSSEAQYRKIRDDVLPSSKLRFLFVSPERAYTDGFFNFAIGKLRDRIGLVVIDEAHCVSQWGHSFRPTYKLIPGFLDDHFGDHWPTVLCLTATLNPDDEKEIRYDFRIPDDGVVKSPSLLRKNLGLAIETYDDEEAKGKRLTDLLEQHRGEKVLVYVHRKSGRYSTEMMSSDYAALGFQCDYFDADRSETAKKDVLKSFEDGQTKIVFATSAFGMGIDIPDIRVVIHYLFPESIEQYYQEVGRAGRDGDQSHCYLLYSPVNIKVRRNQISRQFPGERVLREVYERIVPPGDIMTSNVFQDFGGDSDDNQAYHVLERRGVIKVLAKGVGRVKDFNSTKRPSAFDELSNASKIGSVKLASKKLNKSIGEICTALFDLYSGGAIDLAKAPDKCLFLSRGNDLSDELIESIQRDKNAKRDKRISNLERMVAMMESGEDPKSGICAALGIEEL